MRSFSDEEGHLLWEISEHDEELKHHPRPFSPGQRHEVHEGLIRSLAFIGQLTAVDGAVIVNDDGAGVGLWRQNQAYACSEEPRNALVMVALFLGSVVLFLDKAVQALRAAGLPDGPVLRGAGKVLVDPANPARERPASGSCTAVCPEDLGGGWGGQHLYPAAGGVPEVQARMSTALTSFPQDPQIATALPPSPPTARRWPRR